MSIFFLDVLCGLRIGPYLYTFVLPECLEFVQHKCNMMITCNRDLAVCYNCLFL